MLSHLPSPNFGMTRRRVMRVWSYSPAEIAADD
jgi:hypothetical protein